MSTMQRFVEVTQIGSDEDGTIWFTAIDGRHETYDPTEHLLWLDVSDEPLLADDEGLNP